MSESQSLAPGFKETRLETEGAHSHTGGHVVASFALHNAVMTAHGDGTVRIFEDTCDTPKTITAHDGSVLAMAGAGETGILTGGDDGRFLHISSAGDVVTIHEFGSEWIDCVAAHSKGGLRACSVRRTVHLWDGDSAHHQKLDHPSTIGGLAFDHAGRRLGVSHYGGVTIWQKQGSDWTSIRRDWAGSHLTVTWSPDDRFLISVMQENRLHGWRVADGGDMQMAGYPRKPRSLAWVGATPYLATSGADQAICWPFDGDTGPMGRSPLCLAYGGSQPATVVAGVADQPAVLCGFQDGTVLLSELDENADPLVVRGSTGVAVSAIAMTRSLSRLLIGDTQGHVLWASLGAC